jgi:hypothetical protein
VIQLKKWQAVILETGQPFTVVTLWAPDEAEALAQVREHFPESAYPKGNVTVDPYYMPSGQPAEQWPFPYRRRIAAALDAAQPRREGD